MGNPTDPRYIPPSDREEVADSSSPGRLVAHAAFMDERDARQRDLIRRLADALECHIDDEPCRFDHNGCCQEHGDFTIGLYGEDRPCYMVTSRQVLRRRKND